MASTTGNRYLRIYLQDHLAGSVGLLELARRGAGQYGGSGIGAFMERLAEEIEADHDALERFAAAVGTGGDRLKQALAWTAEKAGRLKLNGHLLTPSPLSPVVELEVLALGIEGKLLLWRALAALYAEGETPGGIDVGELIARGERQRAEVEEHRLAATSAAFEA